MNEILTELQVFQIITKVIWVAILSGFLVAFMGAVFGKVWR